MLAVHFGSRVIPGAEVVDYLSDPALAKVENLRVLLAVFAALGLLLAGIGIFGVLSQSVTQRRREIGIRLAFGAQPHDTLRLVLREGMALAFVASSSAVLERWPCAGSSRDFCMASPPATR